jgi:DNA-binding CsgD family transcriptional regulator
LTSLGPVEPQKPFPPLSLLAGLTNDRLPLIVTQPPLRVWNEPPLTETFFSNVAPPYETSSHLEHIYAKLGVRTRAHAAAQVINASLASSWAGAPVRELLRQVDATELAAVYALADRELELLARASVGDSDAAIAATPHIAPETVKKHLDHVYAKLGVGRRS